MKQSHKLATDTRIEPKWFSPSHQVHMPQIQWCLPHVHQGLGVFFQLRAYNILPKALHSPVTSSPLPPGRTRVFRAHEARGFARPRLRLSQKPNCFTRRKNSGPASGERVERGFG